MREDLEEALALLGGDGAGAERRAEAALHAGEDALALPTLAVAAAREAPVHLASVASRRSSRWTVAAEVDGDDRTAHAALLARDAVVGLAVVGPVAEQAVESHEIGRLPHGGDELRRVVGGAPRHGRRDDEMALGEGDVGELRPGAAGEGRLAAAQGVVAADVVGLEARGVDDPVAADQAASAGDGDDCTEKGGKAPPSRSRRWATTRVV